MRSEMFSKTYERNRERIYDFNPPCPPYPARHKGRNDKSIMKVNFIYLCEFLNYLSFVGDA